MNITTVRIETTYANRAAAIEELAGIVEDLIDLKTARAVELAQKVEAGLYADCKNEDQRKAAAALAFQATDAMIKGKEKGEREARLSLDLANNETSLIEALIKLAAMQ
ncbi:hypothetical protein CCP3SC15_4450002 [Gammaproteobacteria bacterium]